MGRSKGQRSIPIQEKKVRSREKVPKLVNIIPAQKAGRQAVASGLETAVA